MLVLKRKPCERIQIGDSIVVTVVRVEGNAVRLGIEAPSDVAVFRQELLRTRHNPVRAMPKTPATVAEKPV